jgi:hypothetical protein
MGETPSLHLNDLGGRKIHQVSPFCDLPLIAISMPDGSTKFKSFEKLFSESRVVNSFLNIIGYRNNPLQHQQQISNSPNPELKNLRFSDSFWNIAPFRIEGGYIDLPILYKLFVIHSCTLGDVLVVQQN